MTITVFIRYRIDPFKRQMFEHYAQRWLDIIPRCGGGLIGYWLPHEGTNNIGAGADFFGSLADYEAYRAQLRGDPDGMAIFVSPKTTGLFSRGANIPAPGGCVIG